MPLDAPLALELSCSYATLPMESLNQTERDAAVYFARQLRRTLASWPEINQSILLLITLAVSLEDASVRLIFSADAATDMAPGEMPVAWVLQGLPPSAGMRRALAVRLASAAAGTWRQHCQIHRLGFIAA